MEHFLNMLIAIVFFSFFATAMRVNLAESPPDSGYPSFEEELQNYRNITIFGGRNLKLSCSAKGNPKPTINWLKNETILNNGSNILIDEEGILFIKTSTTHDAADYTCNVCNIHGCINYTFQVNVQERILSKPIFTQCPENLTLQVGQSGEFRCEVEKKMDYYTEWYPRTKIINGHLTKDILKAAVRVRDPEVFHLHNVTHNDEGWYSCLSFNEFGISSATAYLKVNDEEKPDNLNHTDGS